MQTHTTTALEDQRITINGEGYTLAQLKAAVDAAYLLRMAYAVADPDNGGEGTVRWEDVNTAHEVAAGVFSSAKDMGASQLAEIDAEAAQSNDRGSRAVFFLDDSAPAAKQLPTLDRKRPDDSEGGTCD